MTKESIKSGQTYQSLYMDGQVADTLYISAIKDETAHMRSTNTGKPVKITLSKMVLDLQHGQMKLKQ